MTPIPSPVFAEQPISPAQIELIRASWQRVQPIQAAAADLFYARLFELAPDVRPLFRRDIHVQGGMLMAALDGVVKHLDRPATLHPVAETLACRHVAYGVQPRHYDAVGTALLWTLEQGLGAGFGAETRQAWADAWAALAATMKAAAWPGAVNDGTAGSPAPAAGASSR